MRLVKFSKVIINIVCLQAIVGNLDLLEVIAIWNTLIPFISNQVVSVIKNLNWYSGSPCAGTHFFKIEYSCQQWLKMIVYLPKQPLVYQKCRD